MQASKCVVASLYGLTERKKALLSEPATKAHKME